MVFFFFSLSFYFSLLFIFLDFPGGSDGKASGYNAEDLGSVSGLGRLPWRRAWQPTPVFAPGESPWTVEPGQASLWVCKESDTTERLSTHTKYIMKFAISTTLSV